ncbi:MAG: nucleotide-binding universal stress UspA family protein [Yoonia sp.]|jgi:nucleotide-binding universal stress UspA family protein
MNRRTILFVMTADTPDHQISDAAEAATAAQDHLICLILGASPALPMYAYGVPPYGGMNIPDNWTELVTEAQKQQRDRVQEVETLLAKSNASGDVQSAMCVTMDVKHRVAQAARVCDEAYLAASLRDTPEILREAASGILFHSPIGFRLNGSPSQKPKRVFVAWDSSEAASSAVHAALPYLKDAQEVVIGCIDPVITSERDGQDPGTDVAAWLSHHGCKVTVSQFPSGGREVGQCIQDRAREFGADLMVMGAYGHARMIQTVLGGTTRSMIEQLDLPILLAH